MSYIINVGIVVQLGAVFCSVLHCVAVRCSASLFVVVCCSALQCVAVCCIVLQCAARSFFFKTSDSEPPDPMN